MSTEVRTVTYSIDGFRRQLSKAIKDLGQQLEEAFPDLREHDVEELTETFNELACLSNSFNCISCKGVASFSDLSNDDEIELLTE